MRFTLRKKGHMQSPSSSEAVGGSRGSDYGARPRLADRTMRSAILDATAQYLNERGLSAPGSGHLIEAAITATGQARESILMVWESESAFEGDVLESVALRGQPGRADQDTLLAAWQYVAMNSDQLGTREGRRRILDAVVRTAGEHNFAAVTSSIAWRNYVVLSTATVFPAGSEERISDALRVNEERFIEQMTVFYQHILGTIGFRLKAGFQGDFGPLIVATAAVIEGMGIVRRSAKKEVNSLYTLRGTSGAAQHWTLASLAYSSLIAGFVEEDPAYDVETAVGQLHDGIELAGGSSVSDTA